MADLAMELALYEGWWRSLGRSESALAPYVGHVRRLVRAMGVDVDNMTRLDIGKTTNVRTEGGVLGGVRYETTVSLPIVRGRRRAGM